MKFIADLHIHSKYSRATAKNLDLENLYISAQKKGITVVATGDFTHPEWFAEIQNKLIPAEEGLFKLKDDIAKICDKHVPESCKSPVRFILVSEISNIYKKNEKTRKNHNLIFVPDLQAAATINTKLDEIGNITSDGRPILGLDARNLLEILLETSDLSFLIPAHIWTPWFSMLGSKSGFNSIEECFEDLTPYIFAVETGLSSDPAMNWRVSDLDGLTLVSNSDAHSPSKLGREANIFNTNLSFPSIRSALQTGNPEKFLGTFEFYPEEGKYHLDGHRKCDVRFWPEKTTSLDAICPICKKPLTLGVLNRVEALSDRPEGKRPKKNHPFYSIIPLEEIVSEILQVGPKSKKVQISYNSLIDKFGSELDILYNISIDKIENAGFPIIGEALNRMRDRKIHVSPGYDGEFGKVKLFREDERELFTGQKSLFILPSPPISTKKRHTKPVREKSSITPRRNKVASLSKPKNPKKISDFTDLNEYQRKAVTHSGSPLLIVAGPGTGKTLTLTHRIAHLIKNQNISPAKMLAITFTNKAAQEMKERLALLLVDHAQLPLATTFHSFCFRLLIQQLKSEHPIALIDDNERSVLIADAIAFVANQAEAITANARQYIDAIVSAKQFLRSPQDDLDDIADMADLEPVLLSKVYSTYQNMLSNMGLYDFEDLIMNIVSCLESDESVRKQYQNLYPYVFVDEYQDLNHGQYRLIKALSPMNSELCVIGDPDQSIYGFRGSNTSYFNKFSFDYPDTEVVNLTKNYRSTETILEASFQVIKKQTENITDSRVYSEIHGEKQIHVLELDTEKAEAVAIGKIIEQMMGGMGFHAFDFGKVDGSDEKINIGFSDFAVLYRTSAQAKVIADCFEKAGIPFQVASKENIYMRKGLAELISYLKLIYGCGTIVDLEKLCRSKMFNITKKCVTTVKSNCYENNCLLEKAFYAIAQDAEIKPASSTRKKIAEFVKILAHYNGKMKGLNVENKLLYLMDSIKPIKAAILTNIKTKEAFNLLIRIARLTPDNLNGFFKTITLQTDADVFDVNAETVTLMTMHAAKGLEFPVVFVAGCESDYIPYSRPGVTTADIDEELRLFYVAMTRAKEYLFLTYAKKRMLFGKYHLRSISPFVAEIEQNLRKHESPSFRKKKNSKNDNSQRQLKLF